MKRILLAATLGLAITSISANADDVRLNAGGSTFVYPMMSKWASIYAKEKGTQINYQSIGSGGGIQQMTAKTMDFGCTDGPMNDEQLKKAKETGGDVVHIPLVMGAVVAAYNLPEVSQQLKVTGPVLADIFMGKVTKWNDKELQDINPGVSLPEKDILVVHRSDGSGTTYVFADFLSKVSASWKDKVGVATSLNWPTGVGQKGNEGVAGQVVRSPGSIGYIEMAYALQNNIKFAQVQNKEGQFVNASLKAVTSAAANSLAQIPEDLRYSITNAPGKDSYPISGTTWAVVYTKQADKQKTQAMVSFLTWATHGGQQYTSELQYAALPEKLVKLDEKQIAKIKAE